MLLIAICFSPHFAIDYFALMASATRAAFAAAAAAAAF